MATTAPPLSFSEVLRDRPVRRLWIAQIVSIFGDFLAVFAVFALVTFKLHGTPTQVSMILVSYLAPLAVISPLAGVYVDRWNVKWTMIASDAIRGVLVLTLVFVQDLNVIYGVFLALSTVSAFFMPAQSVAVRTLAPAAGLMAVNALMTQAVQGSQIIAPSVAGALVQLLGANSCFLFDSLSFFFSAGMVMTLTIDRQAPKSTTAASSILSSMATGFRFILTHSAISFVILAMTVGMFAVRCFGALLSVYVRDVLLSTAATFGVLNTLIGIGMIVGSQTLTRFARSVRPQSHRHLRSGRNGFLRLRDGDLREDLVDCGGHARPGLLRGLHHGDGADAPATGDAAGYARARDQQPHVADGRLAGTRDVCSRSGR